MFGIAIRLNSYETKSDLFREVASQMVEFILLETTRMVIKDLLQLVADLVDGAFASTTQSLMQKVTMSLNLCNSLTSPMPRC
jgi:hypothetical protein